MPKWEPQSPQGQYMEDPPLHARTVRIIHNLCTNHISPQFHVILDPSFHTCKQDKFGSKWRLKVRCVTQRDPEPKKKVTETGNQITQKISLDIDEPNMTLDIDEPKQCMKNKLKGTTQKISIDIDEAITFSQLQKSIRAGVKSYGLGAHLILDGGDTILVSVILSVIAIFIILDLLNRVSVSILF